MVVAPIAGGFKLSDLGGPRQAAERFLATTVAPEGSGRTAVLIDAYERCANGFDHDLLRPCEFSAFLSPPKLLFTSKSSSHRMSPQNCIF